MREYIVTVADPSVWDTLWNELTTNGLGDNFIPQREVEVLNDRPFNDFCAHFNLTDEEATELRNDPRIQHVELQADLKEGVGKGFLTLRPGLYDKSYTISAAMKNWALIRATSDANPFVGVAGLNATFDSHDLEGEGVDIIMMDSGVEAGHPELALNANGTGGSRVVDFDWHSLGVTGCPTGASIGGYLGDSDGHGTNCASIAAGNTCGWASKANIYSIRIFAGNSIRTGAYLSAINSDIAFDLVRAFHLQKIAQGITRPTVCSNSWGYYANYSNMTATNYRGTSYPTTSPNATYGQVNGVHGYQLNYLDVSVENCAAAGVILVGAAGNYYHKIDVPGGLDYDNYWVYGNNVENVPYHRGSSPTRAPSMINVGAVDSTDVEQKGWFSESGPRVDIYAPGVMIMGAYANKSYQTPAVPDPRNTSYYLNKISGTSQATPQVAGVVSCLLSAKPSATVDQIKAWLTEKSIKNALVEGSDVSYSNQRSLQGSANRMLRRTVDKASLRGWMTSS
jgi:hypothetical protein